MSHFFRPTLMHLLRRLFFEKLFFVSNKALLKANHAADDFFSWC